MDIKRNGSQPSGKGPAEWFTGTVRINPLFQAPAPARVSVASVTFEPGARSAWHSHPLGQTLIVTAGSGLAQSWGKPVEKIRPGDVIWSPPGEKHWHGAAATTAMTHISLVEQAAGKSADWMEHVSDEQYQAGSSAEQGDKPMTAWTSNELDKIGTADELQIMSLRRDATLRNPVIIWVVRVGDDLYVRSVNGRTSGWFRGVQTRYEGRIRAGGVEKDVSFVEEPNLQEQIDAAYRTKYRRYAASIVDHCVTPAAHSATLKLVPRATSS